MLKGQFMELIIFSPKACKMIPCKFFYEYGQITKLLWEFSTDLNSLEFSKCLVWPKKHTSRIIVYRAKIFAQKLMLCESTLKGV